jgi:hypothetical protein
MAETTAEVAAGSEGDLPNFLVHLDRVSGGDYQYTKLKKSTAGSQVSTGVDADPLIVANRRRGTSNYDSGLVAVTNGAPASVTASTIYPEGGTLANTSTGVREVTLTTGADAAIMTLVLGPKSVIPLPVPKSGSWAGLKAGADGTGVVLQVAGGQ